MAVAPQPTRDTHSASLLAYRVMAVITGVVLLVGTITLIIQWAGVHSIKTGVGLLWVAHGYLYLVYLITALNLGLKMRWNFPRIVLIALAGTIPTASFFAEHYVTKLARSPS